VLHKLKCKFTWFVTGQHRAALRLLRTEPVALHRLESASDWVRNVDRFMVREIGLMTGNCIPRW